MGDDGTLESWEYKGGTFTATGSWLAVGGKKLAELENEINTLVFTEVYKANKVIRKLYIDTENYNGGLSLEGLKISPLTRNVGGYWSIKLSNGSGQIVASFVKTKEEPIWDVTNNGIRIYAELYWENMDNEDIFNIPIRSEAFNKLSGPMPVSNSNIEDNTIEGAKFIDKSIAGNKLQEASVTKEKLAEYYIQPNTGNENLYVNTDILLISAQKLSKGDSIRFYEEAKDGKWATTQLVEVKSETEYTASKYSTVIEYDENLKYIKQSIVDGGGYKLGTFTTSASTKYISFTRYIDQYMVNNMTSLQEGSHVEALPKNEIENLPIVDTLYGIKRKFNASIAEKSVKPSMLSDETLALIGGKWSGKRILAIGDSITAALKWQERVGSLLNMNVRTHAKGGIGIIQMVDGDGSGTPPEGYDPDDFGVQTIYRLNEADVTDVDVIVLIGFYNERLSVKDEEVVTDMYPTNNTFAGKLNYAIKRVYEELALANNMQCKIVICSAHRYGKYAYNDLSAYDDGDKLYNATKLIADYNGLPCIDLMHCGNVNKYNWNTFQSSSTPYSSTYIPSDGINDGTNKPFASLEEAPSASENNGKYITIQDVDDAYKSDGENWIKVPYLFAPWNADQLHLNTNGYYRIGDYIAGFICNSQDLF